jgi:gliding motility-associated-like protein
LQKNILIATVFFIFISNIKILAQGLSGAELTYNFKGNNTYEFTLIVYKDCLSNTNVSNVQSVNYASTACNLNGNFTVRLSSIDYMQACFAGLGQCQGGSVRSFERKTFIGTVKLTQACTDYKFNWIGFNRNGKSTTVNAGSHPLYVEAMLNNFDAPGNSSPVFNEEPATFLLLNQSERYYNPLVTEADGDILSYSIENPKTGPLTNYPYKSGFNKDLPLSLQNPLSIDSETGDLSFAPIINPSTSKPDTSMMAIKVSETRNGKTVGYVIRDMYLEVMPPPLFVPTLSGINGGNTFNLTSNKCVGEVITFNVIAKSNGNSVLTMSLESNLDGAFLSSIPARGTVTGTFIWRATNSGKVSAIIKVRDGLCPIEGTDTKSYSIDVKPAPSISFNVPKNNPVSSCSTFVTQNVVATASNALAPYTYSWINVEDPFTIVSNLSTIAIAQPGTYVVTATDNRQCSSYDTVRYTTDLIVLYRYPSDSVCEGSTIKFRNISTTRNPSISLLTHTWDYGDGSPILTVSNDPILKSPTHTFAASGTYNVKLTVAASDGCSSSYIRAVKVYDAPKPNFSVIKSCQIPGNIEIGNTSTIKVLADLSNLSYKWFNKANEVVSTAKNATISSSDTLYTLTLEASQKACKAKITKSFRVHKKPRFTTVTGSFFPKCNQISNRDTLLEAYGKAVSDTALTISSIVGYSWSPFPSNLPTLLAKITNRETTYTVQIKDTIGCIADTTIIIKDSLKPDFIYSNYFCKPGDIITLKNQSVFRGSSSSLKYFEWDFNNEANEKISCGPCTTIPTTFQPNFAAFPKDTLMNIQMIIQDQYDCRDTLKYPAVRIVPDTSDFRISASNLCFGAQLDLFSVQGKYINYWLWEYGDGKSDTLWNFRTFTIPGRANNFAPNTDKYYFDSLFNVSKVYANAGNYLVKQTIGYNETSTVANPVSTKILRAGCTFAQQRKISVYNPLKYQIDTSLYNQCAGRNTTFNATRVSGDFSVVPSSFTWNIYKQSANFVNGVKPLTTITSIKNGVDSTSITVLLNEHGSRNFGGNPYVVVLKMEDNKGCKGIDSIQVDNVSITGVQFERIADRINCQNVPQRFFLTQDELGITNPEPVHRWYFDDGNDTIKGATEQFHTFKSAAKSTYNISLKAYGINNESTRYGDCYNTFNWTYNITKAPLVSLSIGGQNLCLQDSITIAPSFQSFYETPNELIKTYLSFSGKSDLDSTTRTSFRYKFENTGVNTVRFIAKDTSKCADTLFQSVNVYRRPTADFTFASSDPNDAPNVFANTPINFKDISTNTDTSTALKRKWYWGNGDSTLLGNRILDTNYNYTSSKIYFVKLILQNTGLCADTIEKKVDLTSFLAIPTAFSPNGDEKNQYFSPILNGIKEIETFKIYNRWGQLVYDYSGRPNQGWDGKFNGEPQPVGSYVYYIRAKSGRDEVISKNGNVSLIR